MSDNLMDKVNALGERLKIEGTEVGQKISAGISSMSFKMSGFFQGPSEAEKLVEVATAETLDDPDWTTNLELCDMINNGTINSIELIQGIKNRMMLKNHKVQFLALVLLETIVKNCEQTFSDVVAERVLDEMVKLIDDPQTIVNNRNKALMLIEAWGESSYELECLPIYEETYKGLKLRGIQFPGRDNESLAPIFTPPCSVFDLEANTNISQQLYHEDSVESFPAEETKEAFDVAKNSLELLVSVLSSLPWEEALKDDLTTTLIQQCQESQYTIQKIIKTSVKNEPLLFEALNVNDELQTVLSKYEDMKPSVLSAEPERAMIPVAVEPDGSPHADALLIRTSSSSHHGTPRGNNNATINDLDEMIFGKKGSGASEVGNDKRQQQSPKDLITF